MARLIDAMRIEFDEVDISGCTDVDDIIAAVEDLIDAQPAVDAAPVVHGRWEDKPTGRYGQQQSWCSVCRKPSGIGGIEKNRHRAYCPNCGARMDGEQHGQV